MLFSMRRSVGENVWMDAILKAENRELQIRRVPEKGYYVRILGIKNTIKRKPQ
jgi:hypothetical protein